MAWTTPKTWTSEVLTSDDMNTYLSDNTQYLYDEITYTPGEYTYTRTGSDYSTTSTSYVDIDNVNMVATITTDGGDVLVTFAGTVARSGGTFGNVRLGVLYNGQRYTFVATVVDELPGVNASFSCVFNNVSAGSNTFTMQWRKGGGLTTALLEGSNAHFSVRELK